MKLLNSYIFNHLLLMLLISVILISGCAKATITVRSPAEINTRKIKNVAVGGFEIGRIMLKYKTNETASGKLILFY